MIAVLCITSSNLCKSDQSSRGLSGQCHLQRKGLHNLVDEVRNRLSMYRLESFLCASGTRYYVTKTKSDCDPASRVGPNTTEVESPRRQKRTVSRFLGSNAKVSDSNTFWGTQTPHSKRSSNGSGPSSARMGLSISPTVVGT